MKVAIPKILLQGISFVLIPGGKLPVRNHNGMDAGLDCFTRAIIDLKEIDQKNPRQRSVITDLTEKTLISKDRYYLEHIGEDEEGTFWGLKEGESVSIGLGFNVKIPFGMAGFLFPRGSTAMKQLEILSTNPIDHGFDGEPWLELKNGGYGTFKIRRNMRLVQLVIMPVWYGKIKQVKHFNGGARGHNSNGSTGN